MSENKSLVAISERLLPLFSSRSFVVKSVLQVEREHLRLNYLWTQSRRKTRRAPVGGKGWREVTRSERSGEVDAKSSWLRGRGSFSSTAFVAMRRRDRQQHWCEFWRNIFKSQPSKRRLHEKNKWQTFFYLEKKNNISSTLRKRLTIVGSHVAFTSPCQVGFCRDFPCSRQQRRGFRGQVLFPLVKLWQPWLAPHLQRLVSRQWHRFCET